MFVFFKRHRVWPNKTSSMLKSSMRTNPLISNWRHESRCSQTWLAHSVITKNFYLELCTASGEGIAGLPLSNAPHHDLESLVCDQEANIPYHVRSCKKPPPWTVHTHALWWEDTHTHIIPVMPWQRSYRILFYLNGPFPGANLTSFQLFLVKQVNENQPLYNGSRECWK